MNEADQDRGMVVRELIGVYNANGSLRGEMAYMLGKLTGRTHCALCDITHGLVRRRQSFDQCVESLPVAFELVHLDERSPELIAASDGCGPCVLVRTDTHLSRLLGPDDLQSCGKDPAKLVDAIGQAIARRGLRWPDVSEPAR